MKNDVYVPMNLNGLARLDIREILETTQETEEVLREVLPTVQKIATAYENVAPQVEFATKYWATTLVLLFAGSIVSSGIATLLVNKMTKAVGKK